MFSSSFTSKSTLVAILKNKHLPLSNFQSMSDKSGGYVKIKGPCPRTDRVIVEYILSSDFISSFLHFLIRLVKKLMILAASFVFVKDKSSMSILCACIHSLIHILYCWSKKQSKKAKKV